MWHHHGSDTPTSPRAILHHTDAILCTFLHTTVCIGQCPIVLFTPSEHFLECINIGMKKFWAISSYVLLWFAHLNNNLSCILAKFLAQYQVIFDANWKQRSLILTGGHVDILMLLSFSETLITTYFSFSTFKLDSILLLPTFFIKSKSLLSAR